MAEAAIAAQVIGTVISTVGTIQQGKAANAQAQSQANQLEARAKQERAVAQMAAIEEKRQAERVSSRAKTLIAAQGGDTTDVGSQDLLSEIAGEGEYRSLIQLYEGEEKAKGNEFQAQSVRAEGKAAKKAAMMSAIGNTLSFASSSYDKFGGGGTNPTGGYSNPIGPTKKPKTFYGL